MPRNKKYRLSALAKDDLQSIFKFTIAHWGEVQARHYAQKLSDGFDMLSNEPESGFVRQELNEQARSFPVGNHVIYYSINNDFENCIEISRILHQSMDFERFFE